MSRITRKSPRSLAKLAAAGLASIALYACAPAPEPQPEPEPAQAPLAASPVLLELFTSQGCSSCPPADRLAAQLAERDDVVVVSRPVTYWDRLGWKDTLALPANTALQRAYAKRGLDGRNGVYTPQIVANGASGTVGSREQAIEDMIAAETDNAVSLRVQRDDNGDISVAVTGAATGSATLSLLALDSEASVPIGRGENGGRTVRYTNVLKSERAIADWQGGTNPIAIPADRFRFEGADRYALILREGASGRVLAARYVR